MHDLHRVIRPYHRNSAWKTKWIDLPSVDMAAKRWSVFFSFAWGEVLTFSKNFPSNSLRAGKSFQSDAQKFPYHGLHIWVKFYLFWFLVKTITDIFYWSLTTVLKHFSPAQHCKTFPNLSNIIIIITLLISSKRLFSLIYNVKYLNI